MSSTASLLAASESAARHATPRWRRRAVRQAQLQDAVNIFELVNSLSGDGTLLRRSYAEDLRERARLCRS